MIFGDLRGEAEIHLHLQGFRDDVVRPGAGADVGDLQAGGLEIPVAPVPCGFHQFTEYGQRRVDWVVRELRIGDMLLFPLDLDGGAEGAAPKIKVLPKLIRLLYSFEAELSDNYM